MKGMWFLNPDYIIRPDAERFLLSDKLYKEYESEEVMTFIHPIHAWVLSIFSGGCRIEEAVKKLSVELQVTEKDARGFLSPWLGNKEKITIKVDGAIIVIPKNILISQEQIVNVEKVKSFVIDKPSTIATANLSCRRHQVPYIITLMLMNKCVTNCSYCYADTKTIVKNRMSLDRILEIIRQAKEIGVHNIAVIGGEVFLYPQWWVVLRELLDNEFRPDLISTKVPITPEIAGHIREIGYDGSIQLSIDSLDVKIATRVLHCQGEYITQIKRGVSILEEMNIPYRVETVLTKDTATKDNIIEILEFLREKKKLIVWEIREAMFSHYKNKKNFAAIRADKRSLIELYEYIESIRETLHIPIVVARGETSKELFSSESGSSSFIGAGCSALNHHLFVLPDGKCTICEQLYWNPRFIIGDLSRDDIMSVWNSNRAYELLNITQGSINKRSACSHCSMFEDCFRIHRNRCWSDVIKAYGVENWDFPDPRCRYAPQLCNDILYD